MPPTPSKRKRPISPYRVPRKATARQQEFLDAVAELTAELGRAPNAGQVAARIGVTRLGARRQLKALEEKGLLHDIPKTMSSGQWALTAKGSEVRRGRPSS